MHDPPFGIELSANHVEEPGVPCFAVAEHGVGNEIRQLNQSGSARV